MLGCAICAVKYTGRRLLRSWSPGHRFLRWAEAWQRCRLLFYPPSVGIGGGRARLPPQIVAGAEAPPRPQHSWRPWVAVRAARFACWMGGYLDPGVGRVFSSCSMFSSVLSLFHHTELTAFSSSKQFFGVFFQNRHYWRVPPGDSHCGESPIAGSVLIKKKRRKEEKTVVILC